MRTPSAITLAKVAAVLLLPLAGAHAMNLNLASPYGDKPSPPAVEFLTFYSHQSEDLLFTPQLVKGKNGQIEITVQAGLRSVGLQWSLHHNMVQTPFLKGAGIPLPTNAFRIPISADKLRAGFYDLRVTLDTGTTRPDGKPVKGVCVFGWNVSKLELRETRPADFKPFWDKAKAEISAVPLDFKMETPMESFNRDQINDYNLKKACLPADYDPTGHKVEEVESCKISFAGPKGGRVYAWLAKPLGKGPFPAMLVLPGAGFNARPRPLEHARHGYLAIDIQIHGQDVDLPKYDRLPGYYEDQVYEPTEGYYYYGVHQRVFQALNFLASRPDVDPKRIVVVGGSQGGRLGIVAAGFDKRVAAVVSCIANSPNYPHLAWVARMNGFDKPSDSQNDPKFKDRPKFDGTALTGAPPAMDYPEAKTFAYYDPMNYAPDITCPVLMNAGLIDPVSPPYSVWGVYNRLTVKDKTIVPLPGLGHDWSAEFDRRAWKWLDEKLKK